MIWYENLSSMLLFTSIVPLDSMPMDEKLNAIMRLTLYVSLILSIIKANANYMFIAIITALLTVAINETNRNAKVRQEQYLQSEALDIVDNRVCALSTVENPFMNVLVTDYGTGKDRPAACNVLDKKVQKKMETNFNAKIYRDVSDIYSNMSSQREFYTMPNTSIPNNAESFAEFCYGTGPTCKEGNGEQCWDMAYRPLTGGHV